MQIPLPIDKEEAAASFADINKLPWETAHYLHRQAYRLAVVFMLI